MKFECMYPYGSTYSKKLIEFLSEFDIPWTHDPRTEGGDSYGFLISKDQESLWDMEGKIQEIIDNIEGSELTKEEVEELWQEAHDVSSQDVVEICTDWKDPEFDDHPEALKQVGIRLDIQWEHWTPTLIEFSLIE